MTMTLYGHPASTCTRKVRMTLAEKNVDVPLVTINLGKDNKTPDYLRRQPFGKIPVLEHDDFRLYESRAICRYLDDVLPGPKLQPSAPQERAALEQWISIETSNFTPHAMALIYQLVLYPMRGQPTDQQKVAESKEKIALPLDVLDRHLLNRAYLAGDRFSLADIFYMPYIEYLFAGNAGDLISRRSNVNGWWERLRSRPSWQHVTKG